MKILFLGGTKFVGRALVEEALNFHHHIELVFRGFTNPHLFPHIKKHFLDRRDIRDWVCDSQWDAVVDCSGYFPQDVEASANFFKGRCRKYVYISSISVYSDFSRPHLDENAPLKEAQISARPPQLTQANYGFLKAACEKILASIFDEDQILVLRPGHIVGPYDESDRFNFWLTHIKTQSRVLAPHDSEAPVQFLDVRSFSSWTIQAIEKNLSGVFNLTGPEKRIHFCEWLELMRDVLNPSCQIEWIKPSSYFARSLRAPLFKRALDERGLFGISNEKARKSGLTFVDPKDTILYIAKGLSETLQEKNS